MNHAHQRQQPARPTDATLFGWRKRNDRALKPNTSRTPTHFLFVVRPGTCSLSWKWRSPDRRRTHKQDPLSLCSWHFFTSLASHHSSGRNQSLSHPVLGSWKTICRTQVTWVKVVAKRKKKLRNIGKPSGNHAFMQCRDCQALKSIPGPCMGSEVAYLPCLQKSWRCPDRIRICSQPAPTSSLHVTISDHLKMRAFLLFTVGL